MEVLLPPPPATPRTLSEHVESRGSFHAFLVGRPSSRKEHIAGIYLVPLQSKVRSTEKSKE